MYVCVLVKKVFKSSSYLLCFFFNKIGEEEGRTGSAWRQGGKGVMTQIIYTHVSKCKNVKIKIF
jgi:hypothetical protein